MSSTIKSFTPGVKIIRIDIDNYQGYNWELRDYTEEEVFTVIDTVKVSTDLIPEALIPAFLAYGVKQKWDDQKAPHKTVNAKFEALKAYATTVYDDGLFNKKKSAKVKDPAWVTFYIAAKEGSLSEVEARAKAYEIGEAPIKAAMEMVNL